MRELFITGTDTEVGKTFITCALMHALKQRRLSVIGFKPVAAGGTSEGNEDALALQALSNFSLSYHQINPVFLTQPVAPHLAAAGLGQKIALSELIDGHNQLRALHPDFLLTEGAGGWRTPLSEDCFLSDLATTQSMDVILVVGVRLGCLNHARLTVEAIRADGLRVRGWVANTLDSQMPFLAENIDTLQSLIQAPRLGTVPMLPSSQHAAQYLDVMPIL